MYMNQQIIWKPINHPDIPPGYLVSPEGYIKAEGSDDKYAITKPSYHSTNGYDFVLLNNKDDNLQLFPLDDIIAIAYVHIPSSLKGKHVKVSHINGDTRDITLDNLEWVEDIEEWRDISLPFIASKGYMISSWGRVRNNHGKILTCRSDKGCYKRLWLRKLDGSRTSLPIHRIQALMFKLISDYYVCEQINHIDGNKSNDYLKNIEAVTPSENLAHACMIGLRECISAAEKEIIKEQLIHFKGSIIKTLNHIIENKMIDNISESIIQNVKSEMVSNGISFDIMLKRKIDSTLYKIISDLLIRYDGNCNIVLKHIHYQYPNINISNIDSVRRKLKREGHRFKSYKHNIKISEKEREYLLKILDEVSLSPSAAYKKIKSDKRLSHVTIYDLKYLKRKYRM